jgi:hypothetical protein
MDAIHARLLTIKQSNGYYSTPRTVARARLSNFVSSDMPSINFTQNVDVLLDEIPGKQLRELTVIIEMYDHHEESVKPFPDRATELASDVQIALWRSPDAPRPEDRMESRLGGIVDNFTLDRVQPAIDLGQKPFCGAVISLTVRYRVAADNPFQLVN